MAPPTTSPANIPLRVGGGLTDGYSLFDSTGKELNLQNYDVLSIIVRAVNCHQELLEELKMIYEAWIKRGTHGTERLTIWEKERLHYIREVIAKAENK